ncbi:2-amino-4-hydroxy-6-hydroxymethyldihydropteridine diphosphokinase [Aureimonas flava]|uniref:2-amino-4-hydroxy-6-hydroxymethyldihydropteridine pyrophosphokinase n=1 Tax=Aureimonas flava TaxID=2320271 RepID=A0A3A1WNX4_9HYPH|nr:2-amino-4-hydroxy-6-hydroxymethyldihydropteridine diphosphokinase [Aureimonas flava]RIY03598.1 2-amino-4-hydroxy-6-hydroxymethyldihydropteridine diphosphokinase [Aureimonas flava]
MTVAFLGLGGNLGDPVRAMATALRALDAAPGTRVAEVSSVYRTPPWGPVEQPPFLNACARVEAEIDAEALLARCLGIELSLHRDRSVRWGPRTVDLDVLDFGGVVMRGDRLTLPHPRMAERAFVMVPLAEIAPDLSVAGATAAECLARLDTSGIVRLEASPDWWCAG